MTPAEIKALTQEADKDLGIADSLGISFQEPTLAEPPSFGGNLLESLYGPVKEEGQFNASLPAFGDMMKAGAEKFMGVLGAPKALMADTPSYAAMLAGPSEWSPETGGARGAKLNAPPQRDNAAGQLLGKAGRLVPPALAGIDPVSNVLSAKDRAMDELSKLGQKAQQEGRAEDAFRYQKLQEMLDNVENLGSSLLTDPMILSGSFLKLLQGAPKAAQFIGGTAPALGKLLGLGAKASVPILAGDAAGKVAGPLIDEGSRAAALPELPNAALQGFFLGQQGKGLQEQRKTDIANRLPGQPEGLLLQHPPTLQERIKGFTDPAKTPDEVYGKNEAIGKVAQFLNVWVPFYGSGSIHSNMGRLMRLGEDRSVTPKTAFTVIDGLVKEMAANRDPNLPIKEGTYPLGPQFTSKELTDRLNKRGLTPQDISTTLELLQKQGFLAKASAKGAGGETGYSLRDPEAFSMLHRELGSRIPEPGTLADDVAAGQAKGPEKNLPPVPLVPMDQVLAPSPTKGKGSRKASRVAKASAQEYANRGKALVPAQEVGRNSPLNAPERPPEDLVFDPEQAPGTPRLDAPPEPFVPEPVDPLSVQGPKLPEPPVPAGELPTYPGMPGTKRLPQPPPALPIEQPPAPGQPDPLTKRPKSKLIRPPAEKKNPITLSEEQQTYFLGKGISLKRAQQLWAMGQEGAREAMQKDKTLKHLTPQARTAILRKLFVPSLAPPPGVGPHRVIKPSTVKGPKVSGGDPFGSASTTKVTYTNPPTAPERKVSALEPRVLSTREVLTELEPLHGEGLGGVWERAQFSPDEIPSSTPANHELFAWAPEGEWTHGEPKGHWVSAPRKVSKIPIIPSTFKDFTNTPEGRPNILEVMFKLNPIKSGEIESGTAPLFRQSATHRSRPTTSEIQHELTRSVDLAAIKQAVGDTNIGLGYERFVLGKTPVTVQLYDFSGVSGSFLSSVSENIMPNHRHLGSVEVEVPAVIDLFSAAARNP